MERRRLDLDRTWAGDEITPFPPEYDNLRAIAVRKVTS
jgi:hypothetical protein